MTDDAERTFHELKNLLETVPPPVSPPTSEELRWLGRASALFESATDDRVNAIGFNTQCNAIVSGITPEARDRARDQVRALLYRQMARAERRAPAGIQGSFIPAGNAFDALAAVARVFTTAKQSLLLVDPYADDKLLSEFVPLADESVGIKVLSDQFYLRPSLKPALAAWKSQHVARALEARLTPPRVLHDRLIIVDDTDVWIITQSFNGLAKRSPASVAKFESDSAVLKLQSYRDIWQNASVL